MCIVFMSISDNPIRDGYKVIIAVNRDEFYDRPTEDLHWWDNEPDIISGVDMTVGKEGGTWFGMTKSGKIGVLTNYRQNKNYKKPLSKGHLVTKFLKSHEKPREFLENLKKHGDEYSGFNLIVGDVFQGQTEMNFSYYCNKEHKPFEDLTAGIYGLSNRYLDYSWKKVVLGKERFKKIVKGSGEWKEKIENIFELLQDGTRYDIDENFRSAEDEGIPDRFLEDFTAISVCMPEAHYGTRTNSVIFIDHKDNVTFRERTMVEPINLENPSWKVNSFEFKLKPRVEFSSNL